MGHKSFIAVAYGAGTNSTAVLIGLYERGIRPDLITFADTGAERPHTYKHLDDVQKWLVKVGFPKINIVKKVDKNGDRLTLEENCLQKRMLPSLAYGYKTCSQKHKIAPQDKFLNNHCEVKNIWAEGGKVTKLIGYDYGEERRAKIIDSKKYNYEYPLIEWKWGRDECIKAIARAGLAQPGKSSCFFCPANTQAEIREVAALYPDLMDRAIKIERNAMLTAVKGLGRRFRWADIIATDDMFSESYIEMACGCYDG